MDLQLTYNQVASLTLLILMLTHLLPGAKKKKESLLGLDIEKVRWSLRPYFKAHKFAWQ